MANPTVRPALKELAARRLHIHMHIHTLRSLGHLRLLSKLRGGCVAGE